MQPVYVISSGELTSGGHELLHQLVHTLTGLGVPAHIVYYPFDRDYRVPAAFAHYDVHVARLSEIPVGARVVLPESYSELIPTFAGQQVYFWWLSVDVYFRSRVTGRLRTLVPTRFHALAHAFLRRPLVSRIVSVLARSASRSFDRGIFAGVSRHLYQSEYAAGFLRGHQLGPASYLGDYLNAHYLEDLGGVSAEQREDLVIFNPAKGREQTDRILGELRRTREGVIRAVPLIGMSREEVRDLLSRAKVYIDFGNHPGRDRIPREAAARGACVLVNRRGSAANDVDMPIPGAFKIDDTQSRFEVDAVARILDIVDNFLERTVAFDPYRQMIASEPARFEADAKRIFDIA